MIECQRKIRPVPQKGQKAPEMEEGKVKGERQVKEVRLVAGKEKNN